jgi:alpha-D-ribose 1-methylphosphonate 5-triphosphate synthase subunit PhnH
MEELMSVPIAHLRENQFDFVHDSQQTFKTIMMALAFPGIIRKLSPIALSFSNPDLGYVLQPLLTLLDLETTFSVVCRDNNLQEAVTRYIEINTNSQSVNLQQADFVLCLDPSMDQKYSQLQRGTLAQPDKSATVFYLLDSLARLPNTEAINLSLTGPGIKDVQTVYISGLDPGELRLWSQHKCQYPLGIDIFLVSRSGDIIGIPRSVKIETLGGR